MPTRICFTTSSSSPTATSSFTREIWVGAAICAWEHGGTTFVNATTWECERAPTVIDIDDRTLVRVHVPPSGAAELE